MEGTEAADVVDGTTAVAAGWRWEVTAVGGVRAAPTIDPRERNSEGDVINQGFVVYGGVDPELGIKFGGHVGHFRTMLVLRTALDGGWSASPQLGMTLFDGSFSIALMAGAGLQQVAGTGFISTNLARVVTYAPQTIAGFWTGVVSAEARYRLAAIGRTELAAVVDVNSAVALTGVETAFEAGEWTSAGLAVGIHLGW